MIKQGLYIIIMSMACSTPPIFPSIDMSTVEPALAQEKPALVAESPGSNCLRLPIGDGSGRGYYVAQGFGGPNHHLGEDWNGMGGGNTDLGDPVYAMSDGVVVEAEDYEGGWGNVVRVRHRLGDGKQVESLYGHLDQIDVQLGESVAMGQQLGSIGTAHGQYLAHLHFEIRDDLSLSVGPGYDEEFDGYLNPRKFITQKANCRKE